MNMNQFIVNSIILTMQIQVIGFMIAYTKHSKIGQNETSTSN